MFDYEKGLFDVVSIDKKRFIHLRWIYILIGLIQILMIVIFQTYQIYILLSVLLTFVIMYFIEKYIKNSFESINARKKQSFYDIFYPTFLSEIDNTEELTFKWISDLSNATSYMTNHMMYQNYIYKPIMHLKSNDIHIYVTEYLIKKNVKTYRLWISLPYIDDVTLEIRNFQRVSQNYPIKVSGSGFMMYADDKTMLPFYKSVYERIRVLKSVDQLDMTLNDDMCDITFNTSFKHRLEDVSIKDKALLNHLEQLKDMISLTQHIIKILKEPKDAYRK